LSIHGLTCQTLKWSRYINIIYEAQKPNYAIKPTPEQALRSGRAILPARLIAALGFISLHGSHSQLRSLMESGMSRFSRVALVALLGVMAIIVLDRVGASPNKLAWVTVVAAFAAAIVGREKRA